MSPSTLSRFEVLLRIPSPTPLIAFMHASTHILAQHTRTRTHATTCKLIGPCKLCDCHGAVWHIAPRMSSFSATLRNIQSFNLHKIIWIMFQNEILVQVSTDGTLLPVNENKNNHEIDLSLWLEIYSFSTHDSFTRNASGISGPQTPSKRWFKNLPLKHAMKESQSICACLQLGGEYLPWGKLSFTNYPFALKSSEVKCQLFYPSTPEQVVSLTIVSLYEMLTARQSGCDLPTSDNKALPAELRHAGFTLWLLCVKPSAVRARCLFYLFSRTVGASFITSKT